MEVHGWLANALDCKSSGQDSIPGCDTVKGHHFSSAVVICKFLR